MIHTVKGLAVARPPLMPTPTKPGPSISTGLARASAMRHPDISTLSRVVGQHKGTTSEIWFSGWTPPLELRAKR